MTHTKNQFTGWHKSRRSGSGENCVFQGVQQAEDGTVTAVGVYDSKESNGAVLAFKPDAWRPFVESLTG
jgi:hypothetical protein